MEGERGNREGGRGGGKWRGEGEGEGGGDSSVGLAAITGLAFSCQSKQLSKPAGFSLLGGYWQDNRREHNWTSLHPMHGVCGMMPNATT